MVARRLRGSSTINRPWRLENGGRALQGLDHVRRLIRHVEATVDRPGTTVIQVACTRLATSTESRNCWMNASRLAASPLVMFDSFHAISAPEHAHAHAEPLHGLADPLLVRDRASLHPIVFERREPLGGMNSAERRDPRRRAGGTSRNAVRT